LGSGGANEIKQEGFFHGVQWNDLYLQPSPFIPELCFHSEFLAHDNEGGLDLPLPFIHMISSTARSEDEEESADFTKFSYCDFESSLALDDRAIIERAGHKGS